MPLFRAMPVLETRGSFLGNGSERGPDCSAEALHVWAVGIVQRYQSRMPKSATQLMFQAAEEHIPATDVWERLLYHSGLPSHPAHARCLEAHAD